MSETNLEEETTEISDLQSNFYAMMNPYNPYDDKFHLWLNQFEYAAEVYVLTDVQRKELFMRMIPYYVHEEFKSKCPYENPSELSYDEIVIKFYECFETTDRNSSLRRSQFLSRMQYETETVKMFGNCLQEIYNKCNYTDASKKKLRKQFLEGLRDIELQVSLSNYRNFPFESVLLRAVQLDVEKKSKK
ncbi:hypothetical protein M0802_017033 [Mischocyttarus mexicanus]|nr:hypothetical protein M0802_017033 [Mischocyttarus mexicanus]